jgi:transcriptional regulator with XRE-family HTH domain
MRPSLKKHNVARLRVLLNEFEAKEFGKKFTQEFDQARFAKLIGCSVQKLRNIETGRTKLDELLARRIADKTGVAIKWLMDGNKDAPPISTGGRKYTKKIYDEVRARKKNFATVKEFNVKLNALEALRAICAILVNANRKRNYHLAVYRTMKAIQELRTEFGEAFLDFNTIEKVLAYVQDVHDVPEHLREEVRRIQQTTPSGHLSGVVFSKAEWKQPSKQR